MGGRRYFVFQLLSPVWLFATPWTTAHQASLSSTIPWSLLKIMSLSQWCHPAFSFSVTPLSFCSQSFPTSGSFPVSQLFTSGDQSIGASASVLPMNIQDWFPLGLTGLILLSKGLLRVFLTFSHEWIFQVSLTSALHSHSWTQADGSLAFFTMWYLRSLWSACMKGWRESGEDRAGLKSISVIHCFYLPSIQMNHMASSSYKGDWGSGDADSQCQTADLLLVRKEKLDFLDGYWLYYNVYAGSSSIF